MIEIQVKKLKYLNDIDLVVCLVFIKCFFLITSTLRNSFILQHQMDFYTNDQIMSDMIISIFV